MITAAQTASVWNVGVKTAAPQNMIAYGTGTFDARDFVRTGLMITLAAFALLVIFSLTYWPWMGYMTL